MATRFHFEERQELGDLKSHVREGAIAGCPASDVRGILYSEDQCIAIMVTWGPSLSTELQTDTTENITLPQLRWQRVTIAS